MQDEVVARERFAQARDPGLDALFLGAIAGGGVEDLDAVAADALAGLQALVALAL